MNRLIITHDKGLLGDEHDWLCDDRPEKANCRQFKGRLLSFVDGFHWPQALKELGVPSDAIRRALPAVTEPRETSEALS